MTQQPPPSTDPIESKNYYDAMDSDDSDDDVDGMDDRLFELTAKNNTAPSTYLSNINTSAAVVKVSPSARHVTASLAKMATELLQDSPSLVSSVNRRSLNCCADSGTTHHMLNDYAAFVSYYPCENEFVTLGDDTQLLIFGWGTARFLLNGKCVEVRDCLHVPDLRNPSYSLRRHRHMHGCGYISQYGIGS